MGRSLDTHAEQAGRPEGSGDGIRVFWKRAAVGVSRISEYVVAGFYVARSNARGT